MGGLPEAPHPAPNGRAEGDGRARPAGGMHRKRGPGRSGSASGGAGQTVTREEREKAADGVGAGRELRPGPPEDAAPDSGNTPPSGRPRPPPSPAQDPGPGRPSGSRPHCPSTGGSPTHAEGSAPHGELRSAAVGGATLPKRVPQAEHPSSSHCLSHPHPTRVRLASTKVLPGEGECRSQSSAPPS